MSQNWLKISSYTSKLGNFRVLSTGEGGEAPPHSPQKALTGQYNIITEELKFKV